MKIVEVSQRRRGAVGMLAIGLFLATQCCFGVLFILIVVGSPLTEPAVLQDLAGSLGTRNSLLAIWAIATALLGLLVALTPGPLRTFRTVAPDPIWRIRRGVSEVLSRHPAGRLPEDTVTPGSSQAAPAPRDEKPVIRCRANDP